MPACLFEVAHSVRPLSEIAVKLATPGKQTGALQKSVDDSSKCRNLQASGFFNDSNDRNSAMNSKFLMAGLVLSALISGGARASTKPIPHNRIAATARIHLRCFSFLFSAESCENGNSNCCAEAGRK